MRETVDSVDFVEPNAKRQVSPLENSYASCLQPEDHIVKSKDLYEELGISSQQFQTLFRNLPQGIALYKPVYNENGEPIDFIALEVNEAYLRIHGLKREQIVWRRAIESYPRIKGEPIDWLGVFGRVAASGVPEFFEAGCPNKDNYYQVYVYSPKKGYCLSIFTNITEQKKKTAKEARKKAEQELVLAEKRYRRLYETTQDGIMARDLKGRMIDCNPAYAKMLGYNKKELRHLTIEQLLPERWHEQRNRLVNKVLQTGRSIVFEREYQRKDGSIFPASVRTWRLNDGKGKAIGIWSIVRDISEQKELQKNLEEHAGILEKIIEERTKQLKDSERLAAIGQTAGMVGHDLRNPLQTITGELYLAIDDVKSLPDSQQKNSLQESIQVIEEQAAYMDKIVSDLQAFVRPVKIDRKRISVKDLVDAVLLSITIPPNITMQTQIDDDFPEIKADPQLLKRVLINLVTNAMQAMPNGGNLNLTSQVATQGQVSITVQDTGVGIPDNIKPQIFTPLFTTKPRGQGFGLAVCKRVMEAHGGTITFESTTGKGAKFTIQLPVG